MPWDTRVHGREETVLSPSPPTIRLIAPSPLPCSYRAPEDDFFCVRYQVWYPSFDCAIRTRFRTSDACLECDQGRFNLKRHRSALSHDRRVHRTHG
jgi:hypothetical protein